VSAGVCESNGEAKRLIAAGSVMINGQKITENCEITDISLVKKGKNSFVLVRG
jgi:tyrosyl-tRNA synthetase